MRMLLGLRSVQSEKRDSNPRPRPWQGRALPTELFSLGVCKFNSNFYFNKTASGARYTIRQP